jgi:polysaccharide biosynthesis/export protein
MPSKLCRTALAATLIALAAACSSGGTPKDADPAAAAAEYRIGPGDQLQIYVWNNEELSVTIPVRPDGRITTPLVADIQAAGRTPAQLASDLEKALSEYVRTPKVNVIVLSFLGADQVKIVGAAANPRSIPYRSGMRLLDVMIEAGGLSEFAAGNRSHIVRRTDKGEVRIPVRIKDLMNSGSMEANVTMLPGDVVVIPESRF